TAARRTRRAAGWPRRTGSREIAVPAGVGVAVPAPRTIAAALVAGAGAALAAQGAVLVVEQGAAQAGRVSRGMGDVHGMPPSSRGPPRSRDLDMYNMSRFYASRVDVGRSGGSSDADRVDGYENAPDRRDVIRMWLDVSKMSRLGWAPVTDVPSMGKRCRTS